MNLRPSEIYFTQDSISSTFGRCTQHNRIKIGETLDQLVSGKCSISAIPKLSVMKENGKCWTADNRRLWIFKHLEKLGKCSSIPVNIVYSIDSRKQTSANGGTDVRIYKGRDPGGTSWRRVDSIKITEKIQEKTSNIKSTTKIQESKSCDIQNISKIQENKACFTGIQNTIDNNTCNAKEQDSIRNKVNVLNVMNTDRIHPTWRVFGLLRPASKNVSVPCESDRPHCFNGYSTGNTNIRDLTSAGYLSQRSVKFPLFPSTKKRKGILKKTLKFKTNISNRSKTNNLIKIERSCFVTKRVRFNLVMETSLFNCKKTSKIVYPKERFPSDDSPEIEDDWEDDSIFAIDPSEYLDSPESFDYTEPDEWNTPDSDKIIVKRNPFDNWKEPDDDSSNEPDISDDYDYRDYDLTYRKETVSSIENGYLSDEGTISDDCQTSLLDKMYMEGQWDSDIDNMFYEYID